MPRCPRCCRKFRSEDQVTRHLSQPLSLCARVERSTSSNLIRLGLADLRLQVACQNDQLQDLQSYEDFRDDDPVLDTVPEPNDHASNSNRSELPSHAPNPQVTGAVYFREEFTGAAKIWGMGSTFTDRFDADVHSAERKENAFYPFASRHDWELACFLLSSGMSMARIDEFLSLELVCAAPLRFDYALTSPTTDKAASTVIQDCKRPSRTC